MRVSYHYHGCALLTESSGQRTAQHTAAAHNYRRFSGEVEWSIQVRQSIK
jgi:hypothetical protein